jgi:hypothetical protein
MIRLHSSDRNRPSLRVRSSCLIRSWRSWIETQTRQYWALNRTRKIFGNTDVRRCWSTRSWHTGQNKTRRSRRILVWNRRLVNSRTSSGRLIPTSPRDRRNSTSQSTRRTQEISITHSHLTNRVSNSSSLRTCGMTPWMGYFRTTRHLKVSGRFWRTRAEILHML